jgi:predicted nucleic-acid-binding protein
LIAFDTNVLVRLLVGDDPEQLARAERLLLQAQENDETCFLSDVVLCELEWVLESSYGAPRATILTVLRDLLDQQVFAFADRQVVRRAIDAYQHGRADFSDYLIGSNAQAHGARVMHTFDGDLRRTEGFATP